MPLKASVVIPTYNEGKDIGACLISLQEQTYYNFEVIVVDDGSTDDTLTQVGFFDNIKVIKGKHKGPGFSRNLGAKKAKGEILIFIDADMILTPDYIKNLIKPLDSKLFETPIGTTHEYELCSNSDNLWSRCWGRVKVDERGSKEDCNNFRAIRKDVFIHFGGFDSKYGYADDLSLYYNHGLTSEFAPGTKCYHKNPETLKDVYKQSRWIGASIQSKLVNNYISLVLMLILSPLIILLTAIRKCIKNRECLLFFPMIIFMTYRFFGTFQGVKNKLVHNYNLK